MTRRSVRSDLARAVLLLGLLLSLPLAGCVTRAVVSADSPGSSVSAPPPFDYAIYAETAQALARFDPGGRVSRLRFDEANGTLTFRRLEQSYSFDLASKVLTEQVEADEAANGGQGRRRTRGPGRGRQRAQEESPDGRWVAHCRDYNVVIEAAEDDGESRESGAGDGASAVKGPNADAPRTPKPESARMITVTTSGSRKHRFGMASWVYGEELDQSTAMWWSPDSRKLVYYEFDERAVPDFYLLQGLTDLRASLMQEGYPKPGEENPTASLHIYDLETGATIAIASDRGLESAGDEWYVYNVRFTPGGNELLVNRTNRHQSVLHVDAVNLDSGAMRRVLTETQDTWQKNTPTMRFLDDGERFIWETERAGYRQYELRHLDGRQLATLSRNDADVISVARVDEKAGVVFYTGYDPVHPLDEHLYRVDLDGSDHRRLTRERGRHATTVSPDGKWFVSTYESITEPPTTVLYTTEGRRVAVLAEPEPARADSGYPAPEVFTFKADDGVTDVYGWLYKPRGFDPARRYPLLIDVYGGPDSKGVRNRYRASHAGCAFGFIVAKIDNRGTGGRGKAFLGAVYQKLGIVDVKDQADGVRHLARRPYIDADRVGIYGHSYGGYMSALAILKFPGVFQVAVAGAPVTDWRNYDTIYTERYMRTPEENPDGYDGGSCLAYAEQLEGSLLILHGMVDDNVHPNNTWQLVDELQDAGKSFDIMFYPNNGHGLRGHAARAKWEYLYRNLIEAPVATGSLTAADASAGAG